MNSLTDVSGLGSSQRAQNYGSLGNSSLKEYAIYLTTSKFNTQDAFNALLMADGDTTGVIRNALFDKTNTVASCFNGFNGATTNVYMVEAQFA